MIIKRIWKNSNIFVCFILCLLISSAYSQEETTKKSVGISAALQTTQFDIVLPIFITNSFAVAPSLGFTSAQEIAHEIALGIIPKFYLGKKKVRPFIDFRFGVLILSPKNQDSRTDFIYGAGFGGEYFLDNSFSFGIEAQLNATKSDPDSRRFGNPGNFNINTGTMIFATVYF